MNPLFEQRLGTSIFETMSLAAARHGAINLGQGFPDFGWPEPLLDEAARLLREGSNQYAPSRGLPVLREAVCGFYADRQGLSLAPDQIVVTSGATEAIAATIMAAIEEGDEAIIVAPAYDAYAPLIRQSGGEVREVALRPPEWRLTEEALEAAVTPRTTMLVLNNPHNPTGRLFAAEELAAVATVARAHDLLILADEVWEEVLLTADRFTSMASLAPERTIKIGSAGKIFSLTGWKIGWLAAPAALATTIARAHQYLTFATPPNLQAAVATGLGRPEWLESARADFRRAQRRLADGLQANGWALLPSEATYFQCIDLPRSGMKLRDHQFADFAVGTLKVATIPLSGFYERAPEYGLVRLCFAKSDATIDAAIAAFGRTDALAQEILDTAVKQGVIDDLPWS
ncbi:aminotransferase class I/II-fold pyridoxal phosphate-dependent enzyme [Sphingomonas sp. LHG3406-1]|uniref:aminotransferase class I/II-fold pyridoxal phosphate-dependent enzyme n=1 Tax=Sphingomonas sp. LHG3406-1 TaxID=2804617 RepID=UPI002607E0FA|nr:aminotransferase class I/II-fold pyridoxal phosphate-dependent enzyme [Sphingomonas sp. LHG3406-1]